MRLSDIMGAADLSAFAEVSLVIFVTVFLAIAVRVLWPGQKKHFERLGKMPLDDERPVEPRFGQERAQREEPQR